MIKLELGTIVPPDEVSNEYIGRRDAFHVACVMCGWGHPNSYDIPEPEGVPVPGMRVRFTCMAFSGVRPCQDGEEAHGIIDPFVRGEIDRSSQFWVLLMPGLASAPRHHFMLKIDRAPDMDDNSWDCRQCSD